MKKFVSFVSLLLVFAFATPTIATADTVATEKLFEDCLDAGMTIEELAAEYDRLHPGSFADIGTMQLRFIIALAEIELQHRGVAASEVVVPMGEYIVGEDIPAGVYTVTTGDRYSNLQVYSNGERIYVYDAFTTETIGKLTLTAGQIVKVQYDSMTFAPYKGIGF